MEGDRLIVALAEIPGEQRFRWKISPLPGRLMLAKTVGGTLSQMDKIFASLGEDMDPPRKVVTAVTDILLNEDGSIEFGLVVMDKRKNTK